MAMPSSSAAGSSSLDARESFNKCLEGVVVVDAAAAWYLGMKNCARCKNDLPKNAFEKYADYHLHLQVRGLREGLRGRREQTHEEMRRLQ